MKDGEIVQCTIIPQIFKAYKLIFGLEDGFVNKNNLYIEADGEKYSNNFRSIKYSRYNAMDEITVKQILSGEDKDWQPFIRDKHGNIIPSNFGDIVIVQSNDNQYIVSKEKFYNEYRIIRKENDDE